MTRFRIDGVDCPVCAQGIEDGIRKLEGVKAVTLDFATLTLHVDALDVAAVEEEAKRIEPGIGLLKIESDRREAASPSIRPDVIELSTAAIIAVSAALVEVFLAPGLGLSRLTISLPFIAAWFIAGRPVLTGAIRNIGRGHFFDELFLMSIATVGALVVGAFEEAVGVMIFYRVGELFQDRAITKARTSIRSLLDLRPKMARLRRGAEWVEVPADEAIAGDIILVKPGEAIPVDGTIVQGSAFVDTKALTGEPEPRSVKDGDDLLGGFITLDGSLELLATRSAAESQVSKIADLVEEASARKAKTERFVTRFARWYTPAVVAIAAATAFIPPLVIPGARLAVWGYRALVMLVISCPCALVLSIPLGYFAGLGGAARRGILVRGGETLDALASVSRIVFDKTGTLTSGAFELRSVEAGPTSSADRVLSLAAALESRSNHPIAQAIVGAASRDMAGYKLPEPGRLREYPGKGLEAEVDKHSVLVGNRALLSAKGIETNFAAWSGDAGAGLTEVLVAEDGTVQGRLLLGDAPKADAQGALDSLRALGIRDFAMLTGDSETAARKVAKGLGIDRVSAALSPEGKLRELESIMNIRTAPGTTMFVGDGTNDAPVIARADVGVALGAGTDAAIGTADVVLLSEGLKRLPEAIGLARRIRGIIVQNIVLALGVKSAFLVLGAVGIANMWFAVVADVGVALLAVLNASRGLASR